jgi:AbrB family looped-hinge helix DNA binding protein
LENEVVITKKAKEVVVTKKGQTTIPVSLRKKYKIEEGTRLQVLDTEEGILLKPKKSIWDMIGAYSQYATAEELNKQLDELRHEDE